MNLEQQKMGNKKKHVNKMVRQLAVQETDAN